MRVSVTCERGLDDRWCLILRLWRVWFRLTVWWPEYLFSNWPYQMRLEVNFLGRTAFGHWAVTWDDWQFIRSWRVCQWGIK